ncbi:MAG TPA: hypothetical protein VEV19_04305, partial [Ktedonobacteraceae bacterium]|nr:hypothetical protein [Ktedonobacteraceae bacterium]
EQEQVESRFLNSKIQNKKNNQPTDGNYPVRTDAMNSKETDKRTYKSKQEGKCQQAHHFADKAT